MTVIILQSTMVFLNGTMRLIVGSFLKGYKLWIGTRLIDLEFGHGLMVVMEFLAGGSCLDLVLPAVFLVDRS